MAEHVHSFYPAYTGITWELECLNCPARITLETANARLNATERLSARVARRNGVILRLNADKLSYGTQTQGYSDSLDLIAYANILEGKDE